MKPRNEVGQHLARLLGMLRWRETCDEERGPDVHRTREIEALIWCLDELDETHPDDMAVARRIDEGRAARRAARIAP